MTKYWIVVGDTHDGPFTLEQLIEMKVSPDTFAWYQGLPKWTKIKDIPGTEALVEAYDKYAETSEPVQEQNRESAVEVVEEQSAVSPSEVSAPATPPTPPPAPPMAAAPQAPVYYQGPTEVEKCPPSYLAWSIIVTICFFLPVGIFAIIYSCRVGSQWAGGNYEKARKFSERTAWLSNIAFVLGLIWAPFSIAFAMLLA